MGDRFKFECSCGQHLVAQRRLAGFRIHCPACLQELIVPAAGEEVAEKHYEKAERYMLVCSCRYRLLVKAEAAGLTIYCPLCQGSIKVPSLETLRKGTTRVLAVKPSARQRVHTDELLLLVDDESGPGTDVK